MRLLYTLTYFTPYTSGLTIHAARVVEGLTKKGHKVTILTTQHDKTLPQKEKNGLTIIRVPYIFRIGKGFITPGLFNRSLDLVKKTDLVVINLPQVESLFIVLAAFVYRKPCVAIYHCEVVTPNTVIGILSHIAVSISTFVTFLYARKIVTYTNDYIQSSFFLTSFRQKVEIILPPIPPLKSTSMSHINSHKKNAYHIGIVSRLASEKGVEYLFEAIPLLKKKLSRPFHIYIAGPNKLIGEEAYVKKLSPLLEKYKNTITFLGTLTQSQLVNFYESLDILVLPSVNKTESFGMVQVEAMLCGTPVVASNLPGVRFAIQTTGMGELAESKNSKDLAEKIAQVLQNKKHYQKTQKEIMQYFSYPTSLNTFENLFHRVIYTQ